MDVDTRSKTGSVRWIQVLKDSSIQFPLRVAGGRWSKSIGPEAGVYMFDIQRQPVRKTPAELGFERGTGNPPAGEPSVNICVQYNEINDPVPPVSSSHLHLRAPHELNIKKASPNARRPQRTRAVHIYHGKQVNEAGPLFFSSDGMKQVTLALQPLAFSLDPFAN
ncbi:unnamed protein product [Pleuronectes platessa]|uniref:Uncharacterized protein n=1 Tax=Pleuronectes platessa TaxID=8262 RepID=A0A9N7W1L5_PLEPL|nr:unnamed protein product [Pleuronectes platessa]